MEASLDTNVIIHLYNANLQRVIFNRFERLVVYEFIRTCELENHADPQILEVFDKDVEEGKIVLITDDYLKDIGVYTIFQKHIKDTKILYDGSDWGEILAISAAKTLGCITLVTDDIKDRGPHYTLMRTPDSDVMPLAFYEVLLIDYLDGKASPEQTIKDFNTINDSSKLNMKFSSLLRKFIKRFWSDPYSEKEEQWMKTFCRENLINAKAKIQELREFL